MPTFTYASPTDTNGVPLGSGVVKNTGLDATQAFIRETDSNSNPLVGLYIGDVEVAGYASITSPTLPANTNAGSDTAVTFATAVQRITLVNYSGATMWYSFDASTTVSTSTVFQLPPGAGIFSFPKQCTSVHIYTASAVAINAVAPTTSYILVAGAM